MLELVDELDEGVFEGGGGLGGGRLAELDYGAVVEVGRFVLLDGGLFTRFKLLNGLVSLDLDRTKANKRP